MADNPVGPLTPTGNLARMAGIREVIAWIRIQRVPYTPSDIEAYFFPQMAAASRLREIAETLPSGDGWDAIAASILLIADHIEKSTS